MHTGRGPAGTGSFFLSPGNPRFEPRRRALCFNGFPAVRHDGKNLDVIAEQADKLQPIEIKSGGTLTSDWFKAINQWLALAGDDATTPSLIYGGNTPWKEGTITSIPWQQTAELASKV